MIIINAKKEGANIRFIKRNNSYISDSYFFSIEYIDNEYDDILLKFKSKNCIKFLCFGSKRGKKPHNIIKSKLHNPICPAEQWFYETGGLWYESYYKHGKRHRLDGPAYIEYFENGNFYKKYYYIDNKIHRDNKPAIIEYHPDGTIFKKTYCQNGNVHRLNGPAVQSFFKNGKLHCNFYYIDGKRYNSKEHFEKAVIKYKNDHIKL